MTTIRFELSGNALDLSRNINFPVSESARSSQVTDRTAAYTLEVEDLGIAATKTRPLILTNLTELDHDGLINWRDNICNWAATPFLYYDECGNHHTVRWIDEVVTIPQTRNGRWAVTIMLEIVDA